MPRIGQVSLSDDGQDLFVDLLLEEGFTRDVIETLQSGLKVVFSYELVLQRPRFLKVKEVARVRVERSISYDSLKDEYLISYSTNRSMFVTVKGLSRAEAEVSRVHVKLAPLSLLEAGQLYRVRVRAEVRKRESGLPFGGMVRLFAKWGYKTAWKEISFSY